MIVEGQGAVAVSRALRGSTVVGEGEDEDDEDDEDGEDGEDGEDEGSLDDDGEDE